MFESLQSLMFFCFHFYPALTVQVFHNNHKDAKNTYFYENYENDKDMEK